jgi:uncharacterized membrane protein
MTELTIATAFVGMLATGALFAFSSFVMGALVRLTPENGLLAMQSINVRAPTPMFMTALFGPALACVVIAVDALAGDGEPLALAGAALYLLGPVGTTIAGNVPLNDALARVDPAEPDAAARWRDYARRWTALNHLRVALGSAGAALLAAAVV